jgi:hypothetical protein
MSRVEDEERERPVSNALVLPSLEVHRFRVLRDLRIERLGRANLIIGMNNVGKTSVLEALRLYAHPGSSEVLLEILEARDEMGVSSVRRMNSRDVTPVPVESLFSGRRVIAGEVEPIRIGPIGSIDRTLSIGLKWLTRLPGDETAQQTLFPVDPDPNAGLSGRLLLTYQIGSTRTALPVTDAAELLRFRRIEGVRSGESARSSIPSFFVGANSLEAGRIGKLWDRIALSELEEDVIAALSIIAPDVERLNLIAQDEYSRTRTPVVKTKKFHEPVPLRSLGDGVNRIFGIVLALVNAKDGILLVDEIENGIHYSVQPDFWRLIFQVAQRLNVQVFATSHSWDCIKAFQTAAGENKEEEGVLVRLDPLDGNVRVAQFDEREIGIAVRGQIEIR